MPPTIKDVAARAGVSAGTVSNVLTGARNVADEARQRVLDAIDSLGYRYNHAASSLRRGKTQTVGVVLPSFNNAFFASLMCHWEAIAADTNRAIVFMSSDDDPVREASRIETLLDRRVDGLLIVPVRDDFSLKTKAGADLPPTVLVDRGFGHAEFDTISSDNSGACFAGASYLAKLGHRDISLLISGDDRNHLRQRIAGYKLALAEAGLQGSERIILGGRTVEACRSAAEQDLRRAAPPTAILAATFFATLGVLKAICALEIPYPERISVLGFDRSEWMTVFRPYLSCIRQGDVEIAASAWRVLLRRINGDAFEPMRVVVPCELEVRESVRPPASR